MPGSTAIANRPATTRRERIMAHLADHPDLTAGEIARALGLPGPLIQLLRDMEARAQVTATKMWWPQQGRRVNVWRAAAVGTVPAPVPAEVIERRRELERLSRTRTRARSRGLEIPPGGAVPDLRVPAAGFVLPSGAACRGADPELFFPKPGQSEAKACAICARCRIRRECYGLARSTGQQFGIWGGVNFDVTAAHRKDKAS